ncbi:hypothetical protein KP22_06665 [Pectobacterium betavasculorum]|uniref:Lipoprotein n=1 Tax=Pectobacterium betavasculorum TaxID=55207 RepID=A0A093SX29_9GAMM|nr:hypothetical protein [Pectobacterium betavasculorum]KFX07767.1 hypothetical protein KP22_06665 [Pectobacterium betavasculorum]KFX19800.1 hypothetical protein JV35_12855 [Pectobacterium betavasculorum]
MHKLLIPFVFLLAGCGDKAITTQSIMEQFQQTGVTVTDIQTPDRSVKTPVPNSYKEHVTFVLSEVSPKGGQVFICEKKEYCDAIYAYFDALKAFAGPYLYQSKNGLIVAQLNSGLTPQTAEKLAAVVMKY